MKKIIMIAAFAALIAVAQSCKKAIDITPTNGVTTDSYFTNQKDMTSVLAGIYSAFQEEMTGDGNGRDEGYGGRYHYWGEVRSDNFAPSTFTTGSVIEMSTNSITFSNSATDWAGLYRVIGRTNLAIQYFPQIPNTDPNVTPTILNNAMAQAYAMRAESYFYIVRVWGDAPLWTTPYLDITLPANKPQTKAITIIDSLIIPDLQRAYSLIQKNQAPVVWNMNEGSIAATLADVYMWRAGLPGIGSTADYQTALTWFANVFKARNGNNTGTYTATGASLETTANWKNVFLAPANSPEAIWSIYWDYNANGCACIPISVQLSNNPVTVDPFFQARWKTAFKTDTRVNKTIDTVAGLNHQNLVYKYLPLTPNLTANTPGITPSATTLAYNVYLTMYRLGDIYLSYAEALAQTGDLTNALKYLNYIHQRAGLPAITAAQYTTPAAMEDAILQERQYELFGEGKRWFDLVRTNRVKAVMDPILNLRNAVTDPITKVVTPGTAGFTDAPNRYYWPVSQTALNTNKLLHQNPGY
jgi:hypothetical protein